MVEPAVPMVVWVKRGDAPDLDEGTLRYRANLEDSTVGVRVVALSPFGRESLPAGARDELGRTFDDVLNVDYEVLGPEGKVFCINAP